MIENADWVIGWLSPEGKMYECEYTGHIAKAEELAKQIGADDNVTLYDEYLLNHGWVHLTMITSLGYGFSWAVIFPYNTKHLSQEQHNYLKPHVEKNLGWISDMFITDLKYEFDDLF